MRKIEKANIDFQNLNEQIRQHNQKSDYNSDWINEREKLYSKRLETLR